jgi:hypothetical protein
MRKTSTVVLHHMHAPNWEDEAAQSSTNTPLTDISRNHADRHQQLSTSQPHEPATRNGDTDDLATIWPPALPFPDL